MSDMNTNHMWVLWVSAESFPSFQASSESVSVDCFSLFILFPCTYTIFVIVANRILQIIHCSKWKTSYFCPSVQFCHEVAQLCVTICELMDCRTPSFPIHHKLESLLKSMSIELVMPSKHRILCHLLMPSILPSIRVFSTESVICIRWSEYWGLSFSIVLPMNIQD